MAAASVLAAVLGAGPAAAGADTGAVGAFGLNDLRSDGILLRNASYDGEADLDAARDAGVRLYRARLRLDCLGPDLDFAKPSATCHGLSYDDLVRELAARDMALLPILINFGAGPGGAYVPVPPTPDGAGGTPTRERFAAFAAAAARRYGPGGTFWATCGCVPRPVRAWEVWNEQNNGWWWGGSASAEDYAGVFRDVRAALRGVDPAARAVVGGVVWDRNGQSSFVEPDAFVAALAAGNANAFDAIAIHPYTDARGASPEQLAGAAAAFTDLMAASLRRHTGPGPDGAPRQQIWITEMGWSDTDAAPDTIAQGLAQFVARLDGGLRAADNVGPVLWYMLRDSGYKGGRDDQLGLRLTLPTGADGGPKPAWDVFAAAAQAHGTVELPPALEDAPAYVAPPEPPPAERAAAPAPPAQPAPRPVVTPKASTPKAAPAPAARRTAPRVTLRRAGRRVRLVVTCAATAAAGCRGTISLRHARTGRALRRAVTVTLPAGGRRTLQGATLRRAGLLRVRVSVTTERRIAARTIAVRSPRRR